MDFLERINNNASLDKAAYIVRGDILTYSELKDASDALAVFMLDMFGQGSPVVVYGHKNILMPVSFLAAAKSGRPYIPVDSSTPEKRLRDIVRRAAPAAVLDTTGKLAAQAGARVVGPEELRGILRAYRGRRPDPARRNRGENVQYVIFTSGSTGEPKGVQVTCNCLQSFLNWFSGYLDAGDRVFLNQAPFSFDLSVMDTYLALTGGGTLFSVDKEMILNMPELFAAMEASGVTTWVSTPSFAEMCLASERFGAKLLPELQKLFFCGETLSPGCAARLLERFPGVRVFNAYGPTEATVAVCAVEVTREMADMEAELPVGYANPGCRIRLAGEMGEIEILGDSVALGYLGDAARTQEKFFAAELYGKPARGYRTGDTGFFKGGLLYYGGRLDNQIKLHGYRVELEDVENNIKKLPFVAHAVVLPKREGGAVSCLTAAVVPREGAGGDIVRMVKGGLKDLLPPYMIPARVVAVETLPMNANGKIDRVRLAEELR